VHAAFQLPAHARTSTHVSELLKLLLLLLLLLLLFVASGVP
jgi:hypothetical protein